MIPSNGHKVQPIDPDTQDNLNTLEENTDVIEGRLSVVTEKELEQSKELSVQNIPFE